MERELQELEDSMKKFESKYNMDPETFCKPDQVRGRIESHLAKAGFPQNRGHKGGHRTLTVCPRNVNIFLPFVRISKCLEQIGGLG